MFGWLKKLWKKGNKLPAIVQLGIGIILVLCVRWLITNVGYQHFKTMYLEGFGTPAKCTYYYMNGCPHCEKLDPIWNSVKNNYSGNVQLKKIERSNAGDDLNKYGIKGFPSIILTDENGKHKEFDGDRTESSILSFIGGN